MIVVRAPIRVSFVGGGSDFPLFYRRSKGQVISATIDKYVYLVVNRTPFIDHVSARYSISETVPHPDKLQHTRIKAALLDLGIHKNVEIGSFASLPARTGLGSSSSFSVALIKGLMAYQGKKISKDDVAREACRLEMDLIGEPVGKQDQYAAAFGGFNVFGFNADETVSVEPVLLDYKKRLMLENHLLLFFTGLTRDASSVLHEQKANLDGKFETVKTMADAVPDFTERLLRGDMEGMGKMLHDGWQKKRSLASAISTPLIDTLYEVGLAHGAWGGKILGAGGGGCIAFIVPLDKKKAIREAVAAKAVAANLVDFREIPVRFVQSGAEILFTSDHHFA